jgi:hypothetical protein
MRSPPDTSGRKTVAGSEFLVLLVGERARIGGTLRVLASAATEEEANTKLDTLETSVFGRVAVVEIKQQYERRPAVQNIPTDAPLIDSAAKARRRSS